MPADNSHVSKLVLATQFDVMTQDGVPISEARPRMDMRIAWLSTGSTRLRHTPDGRQQLSRQFCLADNIIRPGGQHRLPVGIPLQQSQSDDAHAGQRLPQVIDDLQAN